MLRNAECFSINSFLYKIVLLCLHVLPVPTIQTQAMIRPYPSSVKVRVNGCQSFVRQVIVQSVPHQSQLGLAPAMTQPLPDLTDLDLF